MSKESEEQRAERIHAAFPNWTCAPLTPQRKALLTIIRDRNTKKEEFVFYSNRLFRLLIEDALNALPFSPISVKTPTAMEYAGAQFSSSICGVSIVRAGESMEMALREVCQGCRIGKILIQRDEKTFLPQLIYHKMPKDVANRHILLMDPMLGTGGSAKKAIEVLISQYGVPEDHIVFCNLVCVETGLHNIYSTYPYIKIVSACCDEYLDPETGYIMPGVGDFGDRYFGTI